jgi:hypothetical protein
MSAGGLLNYELNVKDPRPPEDTETVSAMLIINELAPSVWASLGEALGFEAHRCSRHPETRCLEKRTFKSIVRCMSWEYR